MKVLINSQLDKTTTFAGTLVFVDNKAFIYLDTFMPAKHLLINNPTKIKHIQFKYVKGIEISDSIFIKGVFTVNYKTKIYEGTILLTPVV